MVKIRLRRVGKKKQPSYRVVVADSRVPRDGRFIESIGHYNPRTDPPTMVIREDRALYWLSRGAQPTDAVSRILKKMGTFEKLALLHQGASIEELVAPPAPATPAPAAEAVVAEPAAAESAVAEAEAIVTEGVAEATPATEAVADMPATEEEAAETLEAGMEPAEEALEQESASAIEEPSAEKAEAEDTAEEETS